MDILSFIGILSGILGIISTTVVFLLYIKRIWRYLRYLFVVKVLNRSPMNLNLSLINKYNEKPSYKFTSEIFKKIKNDFDNNTEDVKRSALRPEITREKKPYTKKKKIACISIKKKEMYIKGSNLQYLNELVKRYYLRRI